MRRGALALLFAVSSAALAQGAPRLSVEPVFAAWRAGDVAALRVQVENDGPAARFVLSAGTIGVEGRPRVEAELELAAGARKATWIALQPSRDDLEVLLLQDGRELDRHELGLPVARWRRPLVAVLGDPPTGFRRLLQGGRSGVATARLVESRPELLPDQALLWPSLDALIWPAPLSHEIGSRQAAALKDWVRSGGLLIAGTNPEEPAALRALDLEGGPQGWGRVEHHGRDLRRDDALAWMGLLDLADTPPSARTLGPSRLLRRSQSHVESTVSPPVIPAVLVLLASVVLMIVLPWRDALRAADGKPAPRRSLPMLLAVIAPATLAALLIGHFGAGEGLVADRLDLLDVDARTGEVRAQSFLALRRARSGPLSVDTDGAGRLRVLDEERRGRAVGELRAEFAAEADGRSGVARVRSWESLRLDARWRPERVELPSLEGGPSEIMERLGSVRAVVKRGKLRDWLQAPAEELTELELGAIALANQADPKRLLPPASQRELIEDALLSLEDDEQWRWPVERRWSAGADEGVLVALAPGSLAPPIQVDGRELDGRAWTIWRVRLGGAAEGGS